MYTYDNTSKVCCHTVSFWYKAETEIPEELKENLDYEATEKAKSDINNECSSGELNYDNEISLTGWWKIDR